MLNNQLPIILALTLCAAISGGLYVQLAPFFQSMETQLSTPLKGSSSINPTLQRKTTKQHDIASFKLFGDATQKVIAKPKPVEKNLPKTNLRLTLTGVMTSPVASQASALIQGPDKETISYKVNDALPGGAKLKQVHSDRVVIERSGRLENLVFVEQRSIGIESYIHPDDQEKGEAEESNPPEIKPANETSNPGRTKGIKDRLSKLRKRMLQNKGKP
jgi:general secretion pathway protein C